MEDFEGPIEKKFKHKMENENVVTKKSKKGTPDTQKVCQKHNVTDEEVPEIQDNLLVWYDKHQRVLPWRDIAKNEPDLDKRGYAVWVSEIMLQQTQVATVISYFNNWIKKWPTVAHLASANLEEVNKVWAGLGYYSRARRLHEGAKIIMEKLNGALPKAVEDLMKLIPGIGLYSASAIASVAFQKPVGVVDGNVIRVLSRLRTIGAPVTQQGVRDHLWSIANRIVSVERPGDFNQALMELGAVICTPQNPKCSDCPINSCCRAYMMAKKGSEVNKLDNFFKKSSGVKTKSNAKASNLPDIENANCYMCLEPSAWKENPQVTVFPCKVDKKSSRVEKVGVVVIKKDNSFLMTKRPEKGLLAGLWEFPSIIFKDDSSPKENSKAVDSMLSDFGIPSSTIANRKYVGEVLHIFSHIRTTYVIEYLELNNSAKVKNIAKEHIWSTEEEIKVSAVSTAMKKVFASVKNVERVSPKVPSKKRKKNTEDAKQKSIKSFFS